MNIFKLTYWCLRQLSYKSVDQLIKQSKIKDKEIIIDPSAVSVLFHETKQQILKLLVNKDLNIREIENMTGLNPGSIKRHLFEIYWFCIYTFTNN